MTALQEQRLNFHIDVASRVSMRNSPVFAEGDRILSFKRVHMGKPSRMQVVRRAYEIWEQAGKPDGRDQEFYHQAERELEQDPDPETAKEVPEDI
jgi:hypothetical protein